MDQLVEEDIAEKYDHHSLDDRPRSIPAVGIANNILPHVANEGAAVDYHDGEHQVQVQVLSESPRAAKITVIKKTTIPKPPVQPRYDLQGNPLPPRTLGRRTTTDSIRSESSSNVYTSSSNDDSSRQSSLVTYDDDTFTDGFVDESLSSLPARLNQPRLPPSSEQAPMRQHWGSNAATATGKTYVSSRQRQPPAQELPVGQQHPPTVIFDPNLDMCFPEIGSDPNFCIGPEVLLLQGMDESTLQTEPELEPDTAKNKGVSRQRSNGSNHSGKGIGGIGRKLSLKKNKSKENGVGDGGGDESAADFHLLSFGGDPDKANKESSKQNKKKNNKKQQKSNPLAEEPDQFVQSVALSLQCFGIFLCTIIVLIIFMTVQYNNGYSVIVFFCLIMLVSLVGGFGWFLHQVINEDDTPIRKDSHMPRWFRVAKKIIRQELMDFRNDWRDMMNGMYLLEDVGPIPPTTSMVVDPDEATAASSITFTYPNAPQMAVIGKSSNSNNNKKKSRSVLFKMVAKPAAVFANYRRKRKEKKKQKKAQQSDRSEDESASYYPPTVYTK